MKIIFSRKGFDSTFGNLPNLILPNGEMVVFPIPTKRGEYTYSDLQRNGKSYADMIRELNPRLFRKLENQYCHVDPDLENHYQELTFDWKPAFGQKGISERHLEKQEVQCGDIFLFFGRFRQTDIDSKGNLTYKRGAMDIHAIYGYMEIGKIISNRKEMAEEYPYHPHAKYHDEKYNTLYVPSERLSVISDKKGYELFNYSDKRRLTAENADKCGIWKLPEFFRNMEISYHMGSKTGFTNNTDYFYSAARGQEFVCDCKKNKEVVKWLTTILS